MNNSSAKKAWYCGIAFAATIGLALILTLVLPFSWVDPESTDKISTSGLKFLIGIFGGVNGTQAGNSVELASLVKSTAFIWVACILMLVFFALSIFMIVLAVRQLIKKENVVNAPHFYKFMVITLFVALALFACGIVVSHQIGGQIPGTEEAVSWFWLPLVLIIGVDVLAHEFLQKFEYEQYAPLTETETQADQPQQNTTQEITPENTENNTEE